MICTRRFIFIFHCQLISGRRIIFIKMKRRRKQDIAEHDSGRIKIAVHIIDQLILLLVIFFSPVKINISHRSINALRAAMRKTRFETCLHSFLFGSIRVVYISKKKNAIWKNVQCNIRSAISRARYTTCYVFLLQIILRSVTKYCVNSILRING